MWRFWTPGWGPRAWWQWFWHEGLPIWIAWKLPHEVAHWAFIRVHSYACKGNPDSMTYSMVVKAWEQRKAKQGS